MSVGLPLDKASVDAKAAAIVVQIRDGLVLASQLNAHFNDTSIWSGNQAFLNMGWNQQEVDWMRGAFTDLGGTGNSLYRIATGAATLTGANDFYFNAKHLWGVNIR